MMKPVNLCPFPKTGRSVYGIGGAFMGKVSFLGEGDVGTQSNKIPLSNVHLTWPISLKLTSFGEFLWLMKTRFTIDPSMQMV